MPARAHSLALATRNESADWTAHCFTFPAVTIDDGVD
jgi:hypothetical protein